MNGEKFCKFCGTKIPFDAVVCSNCGRQVEEIKSSSPNGQFVFNNVNTNNNLQTKEKVEKNKWVAFGLCVCLGFLGAHKFYEGKIGTGVLYACTAGWFLIGVVIDLLNILGKPEKYYV